MIIKQQPNGAIVISLSEQNLAELVKGAKICERMSGPRTFTLSKEMNGIQVVVEVGDIPQLPAWMG